MRRSLLTLLALLLFTGVSWAQKKQITVTGVVIASNDKEPIIAASVVCAEFPSTGVLTDIQGRFTLKLPEQAKTLTISSIGYITQKVPLTGKPLKVILKAEERVTDDVVIVAYGTQKRQSLVGAQASLGAKQLESRPVANITTTLAGVAPGLQVVSPSGQPGEGADIRIRGFGSINASSAPLYVVDGAVYNGNLSDFPASDILNVSILKDAASTALYGSSAGNGVILVTTRRGASGANKGEPSFNFSMSQGFTQRGIPSYDRIGAMDFYKVHWQQWYNDYRLNYRKPAGMSDADWDTSIKQQAAIDVYNDLKYNPYSGIKRYYTPDASGEYQLGTTYDPKKGSIPAVMLPDGTMNPEITGLKWGDDLDWEKALFGHGHRQEYSVSGGLNTEKMRSFLSLGYLDETGFLKNTNFRRYSGRVNLSYDLRRYLTLGGSLSFARSEQDAPGQLGAYSSNMPSFVNGIAPIYPMHLRDRHTGELILDENGRPQWDHSEDRPYLGNFNALETAQRDLRTTRKDVVTTRTTVDIKPMDGLKLQLNLSFDVNNQKSIHRYNHIMGDQSSNKGLLNYDQIRLTTMTFNQLLSWDKDYGKHSLSALLGHESYSYDYDYLHGAKKGLKFLVIDQLSNYTKVSGLTSDLTRYRKEGYFARLNYTYDQRYNFSASFRRDGSSRFAPDARWGNFWSLGAGWILSKESFLQRYDWINELKLRASIGGTGNDGLLDSEGYSVYYPYQTLYSMSSENDQQPGLRMAVLGNPSLVWESQMNTDIALEFVLLRSRLKGTIEFFNKESRNLLFAYSLPASSGMGSQDRNIGKVRNYGLELELHGTLLRTKDFEWSLGANATFLTNRIVRLPDANRKDGIELKYTKYVEGGSIYDFYLNEYLGVDPADGRPMFRLDKERYPDQKGLNDTDKATYTKDGNFARRHFCGSSIPDVTGGFSTNLSWRRLSLGINFAYQLGGKTYDKVYADLMSRSLNGGRAKHADLLKAWKNPGDVTDIPALTASGKDYSTLQSDRFLISSSALALKNIALNYNIEDKLVKKLGLKGAAIGVMAENLFVLSARRGMNPMQSYSGVIAVAGYAQPRTFSTSLKVSF